MTPGCPGTGGAHAIKGDRRTRRGTRRSPRRGPRRRQRILSRQGRGAGRAGEAPGDEGKRLIGRATERGAGVGPKVVLPHGLRLNLIQGPNTLCLIASLLRKVSDQELGRERTMHGNSSRVSIFAFVISAALLSGCGGESKDKDDVMGQILTECQLDAHGVMENSPLVGEKKRFALGAYVEECLKGSGLQPLDIVQGDTTCFEAPQATDDAKGFIKPLQKCWKNTKASKK